MGEQYDKQTKKSYIRIIEAISDGVKRGILDDTRMKEKEVTVLRVKSATDTQINNAIKFCKNQLNKSYKLDLAKDTSVNEKDWYCSELVWASYKKQGINIETKGKLNEPGITPRDILRSDKVAIVFTYK
ncbi:MAG: YiiX/YebB-like N1pC/P60 family cysteine hydrolase [Hominimerdicola sp.]